MKKKFTKIINLVTITSLLLASALPYTNSGAVFAADQPDSPSQPEQPDQPDQPDSPSQPENPDQPDQPGAEETQTETEDQLVETTGTEGTSEATAGTGQETENGNIGDTTIETGDANAVGSIQNQGNTNIAITGESEEESDAPEGITIINSDNGSNSDNEAQVSEDSSTTTEQENSATIVNDAELSAVSGENTILNNTGGDSSLDTGDANTALTVVNDVNTNITGTDIVEFNVVDDHVGDIVLDFSNPCSDNSCVAGTPVYAANKGNGSDSNNLIESTSTQTDETFQENDATIENLIILESDSGDNTIKGSTNGDNSITTGDANVSANVTNFANNNITGNVVVGIVNIFGDLIGDIIIPQSELEESSGGTYLANVDNGSDSQNFLTVDQDVLDQTTQQNAANIDNNLNLAADTGNNKAMDNTNGNNSIETGEANIVAQILNLANTNILGGEWWIVLVNEAGNWFGKIVGGQEGVNYAGSDGTDFKVSPDGTITAMNSGNGSGSTNNIDVDSQTTNTTTQQNTANITNNLQLTANTGGNTLNNNTGGENSVSTGDANVVASVINFINNNFIGGQVYLTVVNVFGSWFGDIVPPGEEKEAGSNNHVSDESIARGGMSGAENSSETNNNEEDQDSQSSSAVNDNSGSSFGILRSASSIAKNLSPLVYESDKPSLVAGATSTFDNVSGKRVIRINLAPLILFAALMTIIYTGKRVLPLLLSLVKKRILK